MIEAEQFGPVRKYRLARSILGRPAYWTAAYSVEGLLVDTGCRHTAQELLAAVRDEGIHTIINTHHHEDHIGANAEIRSARGARIYAHPEALPYLSDPRRIYLQPYRKAFWGRPRPSLGEAVPEWVETDHHTFQVIHTPGHSPDHVTVYQPSEGWLFTGDLFIGGRDRTMRPDYDIEATLQSLRQVAELPASWLFPGSGSVRKDPLGEIRDKIAHIEELRGSIRALHARGWSEKQIARELLGREGMIHYLTGGHFSRVNLVKVYLREA